VTADAGTPINGGAFTIPDALGNRAIHPYSDFLLHDIGTGDGIPIEPGQAAAAKDAFNALNDFQKADNRFSEFSLT
jgi:hypothetical protein